MSPEPSVNVSKPGEEALRAHATRLSPDWQLPKPWGDWALKEQPAWNAANVRWVADNFRDHWIAVAGRDGTKLDWFATWRKWVRKEGATKVGRSPEAPRVIGPCEEPGGCPDGGKGEYRLFEKCYCASHFSKRNAEAVRLQREQERERRQSPAGQIARSAAALVKPIPT